MINNKKTYIGSEQNEYLAAQLYDKVAILINGLKVSKNVNSIGQNKLQLLQKRCHLNFEGEHIIFR